MTLATTAIERVLREESGAVFATLIRGLSDFDLAEEALQEACARAVATWPAKGLPEKPAAWLTTAARRYPIDRIRRERLRGAKQAQAALRRAAEAEDRLQMIDTKRLAVGGHSRGGNAALRAARSDSRVRACLALAPSGPLEATDGKGACPVCLIIGTADSFLGAARKAYTDAPGERFLIEVPGMTHMLDPREATLKLVKRSTAFLNYALKSDKRYRGALVAEGGGLVIKQAGP